jgi:hypothetical protein
MLIDVQKTDCKRGNTINLFCGAEWKKNVIFSAPPKAMNDNNNS